MKPRRDVRAILLLFESLEDGSQDQQMTASTWGNAIGGPLPRGLSEAVAGKRAPPAALSCAPRHRAETTPPHQWNRESNRRLDPHWPGRKVASRCKARCAVVEGVMVVAQPCVGPQDRSAEL